MVVLIMMMSRRRVKRNARAPIFIFAVNPNELMDVYGENVR